MLMKSLCRRNSLIAAIGHVVTLQVSFLSGTNLHDCILAKGEVL